MEEAPKHLQSLADLSMHSHRGRQHQRDLNSTLLSSIFAAAQVPVSSRPAYGLAGKWHARQALREDTVSRVLPDGQLHLFQNLPGPQGEQVVWGA